MAKTMTPPSKKKLSPEKLMSHEQLVFKNRQWHTFYLNLELYEGNRPLTANEKAEWSAIRAEMRKRGLLPEAK